MRVNLHAWLDGCSWMDGRMVDLGWKEGWLIMDGCMIMDNWIDGRSWMEGWKIHAFVQSIDHIVTAALMYYQES